jgi:hypothetical protein
MTMRIKLSQSDWQRIGEQMGWMKEAFSSFDRGMSGPEREHAGETGREWDSTAEGEEAEAVMGKIIDHNARVRARLGGGGKADENDRYAAHKIISEAEAHGHEGLAVNSDGMIVKTKVVDDWLGRGSSETSEPITVDTKSWGKNWRTVETNHPGHPL